MLNNKKNLLVAAGLSRCKPVCNLTKNAPLNSGRSGTKTNSLFVLFKWPSGKLDKKYKFNGSKYFQYKTRKSPPFLDLDL